jgi:hypothetical protein
LQRLRRAVFVVDIDAYPRPADQRYALLFHRLQAYQVPTIRAVRATHAQLHLKGFAALLVRQPLMKTLAHIVRVKKCEERGRVREALFLAGVAAPSLIDVRNVPIGLTDPNERGGVLDR